MPNVSETSVSDMSLSPAWSVMIIFLLVDSLISGQAFGPLSQRGELGEGAGRSGKRLGRTARTVTDWRLSKDLSRETTVGGRDQQQKLNSHDQLGRNPRAHPSRLGCARWSDLFAPRGSLIDSGLGPAKGPACDCCSILLRVRPGREPWRPAMHQRPGIGGSAALGPVNGNRKLISCRQVKFDQFRVHSESAVSAGARPRSRFLSR
jgi:hypothetical protein